MGKICILTDSSAQFSKSHSTALKSVHTIPLYIEYAGKLTNIEDIKLKDFPNSADDSFTSHVIPPTLEEFKQIFQKLIEEYDEVLGIFLSSKLNPCFMNAQKAITSLGIKQRIQLIDSQSTSTGLGYMVNVAAEASSKGSSLSEVQSLVFDLISRTYVIFCCPGLTYLYQNNYVDYAQGVVGEMLNILPIFAIEDGKLTPLEKLRNNRQVIDFFQEYLGEFDRLEHISFIQSNTSNNQMMRYLREFIKENFSTTPFTEHKIHSPLAALLGPQTLGLILVEAPLKRSKHAIIFDNEI